MRRNEAENIIGSLVITGMIKGGYYIGELIEVIPSKPFRANVKVKGVYEYPKLYNHNTRPLCFKEKVSVIAENEIVNTGNSIKKYEEEFISYNYSLKRALLVYLSSVQRTLDEYENNNGRYHTYYINDMSDAIKLKDMLIQRIDNIKEDWQ